MLLLHILSCNKQEEVVPPPGNDLRQAMRDFVIGISCLLYTSSKGNTKDIILTDFNLHFHAIEIGDPHHFGTCHLYRSYDALPLFYI